MLYNVLHTNKVFSQGLLFCNIYVSDIFYGVKAYAQLTHSLPNCCERWNCGYD